MAQLKFPVADLHCDLLSYLEAVATADAHNKNDIGCNLQDLKAGFVKLQITAIYTATGNGSSERGLRQSMIFKNLLQKYSTELTLLEKTESSLNNISESPTTHIVAAIENASSFCEENDSLKEGFKKLDSIIKNTSNILYIGLTHHGENRFGGGNTTNVGLKDDGKTLLDYMHNKKIAIDLSHTSDNLAYDILNHLTHSGLDIPVIASHSNFRNIFKHARNLPDDLVQEIIKRKGLIGINFLRAFLNDKDPNAMTDHILYGLSHGADDALCFGADYFYTSSHPDPSRKPFYNPAHENASCYQAILKDLSKQIDPIILEKIAGKNVINFLKRSWL